jgi:hypothetical protein
VAGSGRGAPANAGRRETAGHPEHAILGMELEFSGAAREVNGSCHIVRAYG